MWQIFFKQVCNRIISGKCIRYNKGYLISQAPSCIIYLESESDMTPIYPQLRKTNKNSILNFARVGDAISFCYYDYLCKIEPRKLLAIE